MAPRVHWDPIKAAANWRKHGVAFEEAETVFNDPQLEWRADENHSDDEDRFLVVGRTRFGRILVVVYCIRDDDYRLIHARPALPAERRRYMGDDRIRDAAPEKINLDDIPEIKDFSGFKRTGRLMDFSGDIIRVSIQPDVARYYSDSDAVNEALRTLIAEGRAPAPRKE